MFWANSLLLKIIKTHDLGWYDQQGHVQGYVLAAALLTRRNYSNADGQGPAICHLTWWVAKPLICLCLELCPVFNY